MILNRFMPMLVGLIVFVLNLSAEVIVSTGGSSTEVTHSTERTIEISGKVFVDANLNGIWEPGEKCLKNAGVSDGRNIVWTDKKGRYVFKLEDIRPRLFPIVPEGFLPLSHGIQNAVYIAPKIDIEAQKGVNIVSYDIPLVPCKKKKKLRAAIVGDIQVKNHAQVVLARNTILSELASRDDIDMMVHMGDLINNDPAVFPEIVPSLDMLPFPVWSVIGNHDLDRKTEPITTDMYVDAVGMDIAAWFRHKSCFIMLDNVNSTEYRLSEDQMEFLSQLLERCPKEDLIVLLQHVPMIGTKNYEQVLSLLEGRKVLILSGHAHQVFRNEWSENISEVTVGAACGSWWTGERDMWNVPIALQQCGSPRNYFIFDFDGNNYSYSFKGVRLDPTIQADAIIKDNKLIVNVYGGGDSTEVSFNIKSHHMRQSIEEWQFMTKKDQVAPYVARMAYMNRNAGFPTKGSRRTPLRTRKSSSHIWEAELPSDVLQKQVQIRIRVRDSRGMKPFEFYYYQ